MKLRTIQYVTVLALGCGGPSLPSPTPQDTYIKEATVLEHLQAEYDRLIDKQDANWKSAEDLLEQSHSWELKGDKVKSQKCLAMMERYMERGEKAGEEATDIYPEILAQQSRVDIAKKALKLTD